MSPTPDTVDLTDLAGHVQTLQQIKAKQAELAELRAQLEQTVKDRMGEATHGTIDGITVVTWRRVKRTALDQRALKREQPEIHASYQSTTEVRRFEVTS